MGNLKVARSQLDRPMKEVRQEAESLLSGQSVEKSTNYYIYVKSIISQKKISWIWDMILLILKLYDLIVNKKANPMQATRSDLRAKDLPLS